jgi:hypothetical protein
MKDDAEKAKFEAEERSRKAELITFKQKLKKSKGTLTVDADTLDALLTVLCRVGKRAASLHHIRSSWDVDEVPYPRFNAHGLMPGWCGCGQEKKRRPSPLNRASASETARGGNRAKQKAGHHMTKFNDDERQRGHLAGEAWATQKGRRLEDIETIAQYCDRAANGESIDDDLIVRMHFAFGHNSEEFSPFENESAAYVGAWYAAVWEIARKQRQ